MHSLQRVLLWRDLLEGITRTGNIANYRNTAYPWSLPYSFVASSLFTT
ncbi:hypothetical protein O9992_07770 [Vibrio lentus]|nr:hypothetical protein [Vibrio lentus]